MFLAVDIGGTKTLLAVFDGHGHIQRTERFPTPEKYEDFLQQFRTVLAGLQVDDFRAAGVAVPGKIDRIHGRGLAFGNLPWRNVPIQADMERLINAPVVIENDANLAGLSEASLLKNEYRKVLYVTISTGIGTGIIVDGIIAPAFADSEGGDIMVEHRGKLQKWERFASGRAIVRRYGQKAADITDPDTWRQIASDLAVGLLDLIAVVQPEVIIIGGGVGTHFQRYRQFLEADLKEYENPLLPIPPLREAARPEEAVIYGCYELAKAHYGLVAR